MLPAIIISRNDIAGMNILEHLSLPFVHVLDGDTITAENLDKRVDADLFIFATRHQSKSGIPSLTVHTPGNFGQADFGGSPGLLCVSAERYAKKCFQLLESLKPASFEVIMEATHHGPLIQKPCMFIELGSDETGWRNKQGGKAIAQAITTCLAEPLPAAKTAIAIGGPHHGPNFLKILRESEFAISHLCPKYNLQHLDDAMLQQMLAKSMQPAEKIFLDWKGLGEHKERIFKLCEATGLMIEKV